MNKKDKLAVIREYSGDQIVILEDDILKLQTRFNQYVNPIKEHLINENIQNSIDEALSAENSICDKIYIEINKEGVVTIKDNGRGIPHDKLFKTVTTIQSSGKFNDDNYNKPSAGENGVGLTATNALSDFFIIISERLGKKLTLKFEHGKLIDTIEEDTDIHKSGLTVLFKPSSKYFGKEPIDVNKAVEWLDKISAFCTGLVLDLYAEQIDTEVAIVKRYENKDGIMELYDPKVDNLMFTPVHLKDKKLFKMDNPDRYGKRDKLLVDIEFIMSYDKKLYFNDNIESFCNFVITKHHGEHITGAKQGIGNALLKLFTQNVNEKYMKKYKPSIDDMRNGLYLKFNLFTKHPIFEGQNKEKVGNRDLRAKIASMTEELVYNYFTENEKLLKLVIKFIQSNIEQRHSVESEKATNTKIMTSNSYFDVNRPDNYRPPTLTKEQAHKLGRVISLYLLEGKSAGGGASQVLDPKFNGVFPLRGVVPNVLKFTHPNAVYQNKELGGLLSILRCGTGEKCDVSKLPVDMIKIMTDADPDGAKIESLLCNFFISYLYKLVEAGYLYSVVTPLYKLRHKKKDLYLNSKKDFIELTVKNMVKDLKVFDEKNNIIYNEGLTDILSKNADYLYYLEQASLDNKSPERFIEMLAMEFAKNDGADIKELLQNKYPYLNIIEHKGALILDGEIDDNGYILLVIDDIFRNTLEILIEQIKANKKLKFRLTKGGDIISLGDLLHKLDKYRPMIIQRYKGIGELDPTELYDVALDESVQQLVQLTLTDLKKTADKFNILHGKDIDSRKKMMESYILTRELIDN